MKAPRVYDIHQPDYNDDVGCRLVVFIDGVEQSGVLRYDIDNGLVERQKYDEHGHLMFGADLNTVEIEVVHGKVAVVLH